MSRRGCFSRTVLPIDNSDSNETKLWKVKPILIDLHRVNVISSEKTEKIFSMELESSKQTMNLYI